jgi:hypothetical protein
MTYEPINIDLSGPVDINDLAAAVTRVVADTAIQITNKAVTQGLTDLLDNLLERFSAEAHASRLGLTISGTTNEAPEYDGEDDDV